MGALAAVAGGGAAAGAGEAGAAEGAGEAGASGGAPSAPSAPSGPGGGKESGGLISKAVSSGFTDLSKDKSAQFSAPAIGTQNALAGLQPISPVPQMSVPQLSPAPSVAPMQSPQVQMPQAPMPQMLGVSDIRAKTNIKQVNMKDMDAFLQRVYDNVVSKGKK